MSEAPDRPTVLDSTVLSNFAHVDDVELLVDLPRVVTVAEVKRELERGAETHQFLDAALLVLDETVPVISPSPRARDHKEQLLESLDPGEAEALAVAETSGGTLVTDDGDAREMAERRQVEMTGSIGLLVRFVEDDRLSAESADVYLKRWIDEAGFRSPSRDFDDFLGE